MERVMTVDEVAAYLHRSKYTIRNWIKKGLLPAARLGRSYVITEDSLSGLINRAPGSKKVPYAESKRLLLELREMGRAAGLNEKTYHEAIRKWEALEEEDRREAERKWR